MARGTGRSPRRAAVLRRTRTDEGPAMRAGGDPQAAARHRSRGRSSSTIRAAPAAPRACGRDVTRGDLADRDPAPTRALCAPGDHLALPARDRQHRDHPSRASAARTDDPRRSRTHCRALIAGGMSRMFLGRGPARPTTSSPRKERDDPAMQQGCLKSPLRSRGAGWLDHERAIARFPTSGWHPDRIRAVRWNDAMLVLRAGRGPVDCGRPIAVSSGSM